MKVREILRTGVGRSPFRAPAILPGQDEGFRIAFGNGGRGQSVRGYRQQGAAEIARQLAEPESDAGDSFVMASERHHQIYVIPPDYSAEARMGSASADNAPIWNPEGCAQGIQPVCRRIGSRGGRGLRGLARRSPPSSGGGGGIKDEITPGMFHQGLCIFRQSAVLPR